MRVVYRIALLAALLLTPALTPRPAGAEQISVTHRAC